MADAASASASTPKPNPKRAKPKYTKAEKAARKAANDAAHFALVLEAAYVTVEIFTKQGIPCTIFGSLASRLYGAQRCPKDVDMLIYQDPNQTDPWTAAGLKKLLLDKDPAHFYLTLPKDPTATYRVLWYRQFYLGPACKVDLLIPGTMFLPNIAPSPSSVRIGNLPLVPFSLLLLHKLQGWDDHRLSEEAHKRRKMPQDAADVRRLLELEAQGVGGGGLREAGVWSDRALFSEEFEELTRRRVRDFCVAYPKLVDQWRTLRFEVPDPVLKAEGAGPLISGEGVPLEENQVDESDVDDVDEGAGP